MAEPRKKKWIKVLVMVAALAGLYAILHLPIGSSKIEVSYETTRILGPLNPDGTVNYVAAINDAMAKGVTNENNAAIELVKILGSLEQNETMDAELLRSWGLKPKDVPAQSRFIQWEDRTPSTSPSKTDKEETVTDPTDKTSYPLSKIPMGLVRVVLQNGKSHPDLEGWLQANGETLDRIAEIARTKTRFCVPLRPHSEPPEMIRIHALSAHQFRSIAHAFAARAILQAQTGNHVGAWSDILAIHRLARLVDQSPFVIQHLIAMAMESMASRTGTFLIEQHPPDRHMAQELASALGTLPPLKNFVTTIDHERYMALDFIVTMFRKNKIDGVEIANNTNPAFLDWNEMLRVSNDWHDRVVAVLRDSPPEDHSTLGIRLTAVYNTMEKEAGQVSRTKVMLATVGGWPFRKYISRQVGMVLLSLGMPHLDKYFSLQDRTALSLSVEQATLALVRFKADRGHWPAELGELCPAYLPSVPADLFSGKPLIYRTDGKGFLLYSIGPNRRDDGGVDDRQQQKDDIAARVQYGPNADGAATKPASSRQSPK